MAHHAILWDEILNSQSSFLPFPLEENFSKKKIERKKVVCAFTDKMAEQIFSQEHGVLKNSIATVCLE